MRQNLVLSLVFFGTALCLAPATWAQAPGDPGDPLGANPPVRQDIGMPDTLLGNLTEAECRICHTAVTIERHHNLFGDPIPGGSIVPFPDGDDDGVDDTEYGCLNCHEMDESSGSNQFLIERDCIVCHTSTAHHATAAATSGDCYSCHGDVVTPTDDGHYIPTYDPSRVTPAREGGTGLPLNSRTNGAGACDYCHDDDGKFSGGGGDPDERIIRDNDDLHHGQGFGDCVLCHITHTDNIRDCERCHGLESLHNIQADSNGDGIIEVGGELPGYGHVGAGNSECWGCHGFLKSSAASAPGAGPVIPTLYNVDVKSIAAGTETAIVLTGVGFTNTSGNTSYEADVRLTASDGSTVTLQPDAVSQATVAVTIPGRLAPGNYKVQAVKKHVASNPAVISIVPAVTISSVTSDGTVTINGSGFGGHADGSGTSVNWPVTFGLGIYQQAMIKPATILSWTDTQIVADFGGSAPDEVIVNSVFGAAAANVPGVSQPEPEPEPEPEPQPETKPRGEFSFGGDFGLGTK